ncbi:MAG: alpha/beta hydrolase, partial [Gammaproteobacteria bacterium]|nr:alpha/beta hydrolase [Gammaproteobacteria bacterium]
IRQSSLEDFWTNLDKTSSGQRPILYTHGFYISFDRGCRRASEFKKSLDLVGRLVLFSWPSDGVIVNYTNDEADVYWSVDPLQETLNDMINRYGAGNINIAAHSLGTRGVMLALVRIASAKHLARDTSKPLINQVVLLAPDIDAGIFKQYLPHIKSLAKNITVYVSQHDSPLALSRQLHGYPRLGESGSHLDGLNGIEIIDISDVTVQYPSGHLYHLYNDEVVADLHQLLNENKPATARSNLKHSGENYWRLQPAIDMAPTTTDKSADDRQPESSQNIK